MKRFCFLAVLIALSVAWVRRPMPAFDFIQRRQPPGAHRIRQALPFGVVRLDVDLQTPRLAPQARPLRRRARRVRAGKACAAVPQTVSPPAPPATTAPAKTIVPRRRRRLHGGRIEELTVDVPPLAPPPVQQRFNSSAAGAIGRKTGREPRSLRRRSSASRIRPRKKRRRILRSATGRPKARERCGSESAAMRCAASCSVHRTRSAKRS